MNVLIPASHRAVDLPLLPPDRQLSPDELRGFNIACGCIIRWGQQIAHNGARLGGTDPVHHINLMRDRGLFAANLAEALHLTLGQGRSLSPKP